MRHRSWLYIPASNARALQKGTVLFPDAFIFDLEDAVAPEKKAEARQLLTGFLPAYQGRNFWLRINHPTTPYFADDLAFAKDHGIYRFILPKTEYSHEINILHEEFNYKDEIIASIETPKGLLEMNAISAQSTVKGVIAGLNDLAFALQRKDEALASVLDNMQITAKAFGKLALDGVYNHFQDDAGFTRHAQRGKDLGFDGKTLIHPSQIALTHQVYCPGVEEYKAAKAMLDAVTGNGAARFQGQMVEAMHVEAARHIVSAYESSRYCK